MNEARTLCDVAQPRCSDVVIGAAVFAPNAAGRRELSCLGGLSQRQLLKSRGAFLADRVLVAVTPLEVVAMALGPLSRRYREPISWRRDEVVIRPVKSRRAIAQRPARAFLIAAPTTGAQLELAADCHDANTARVTSQLLAIGRHDIVHQ
jgi:hypothetical protein